MTTVRPLDDVELLAGSHSDPELFAEFYRRHLPAVTRYLLASCRDPELTADLTGEVFATALKARDRFRPHHPTALPWLLTIARNKLTDARRRGVVDAAARRSLGIRTLEFHDDDFERVEALADEALGSSHVAEALAHLDPETRQVLLGRIVREQSYDELACEFKCSPQVARKRVSRGLARMREILETR